MKIKSLAIGVVALMCLAFAAPARAQGNHADIVESIKSDLVRKGVDLSGACGAFQITERVAWVLHDQGYKFLKKSGGNRAVPQADGSCLDGDHTSAPGFATDYLISTKEGFVGYDLLGDGGGANNSQWIGPESDAEMVARNLKNFGEPFNPGDTPSLPPSVPPSNPPSVPPSPGVDVQPLKDAISALTLQVADLQSKLAALVQEMDKADAENQQKLGEVTNLTSYLKAHPIPDGCRVSFLGCRLTFNGTPLE
jgi:hypothetical protein